MIRCISGTETFFGVWKGDGRATFEAGDTAVEFSVLDPREPFWLGCLSTVAAELKRASAETGRSFVCQLTTRDGNLCGKQFPRQEKRCVRIGCGLPPWVVVMG